ncbi:outer membrane lipid asymmetry maintenance protein MlaD [Thiomicrospira sp. WB1]|uniref:outer membrane lipid asymmetry maintenance protein MlaD n=1 Tax=Thiomicrospira sp. WB1 TaxID=1685380 RepID=UPI0007467499|nr:outer membrane lipid asymmetry maintenance protein MlaD [Thiomicrospira sp. WB1]KUJ72868.1 outer membrane lipid asymmetry maintenance protein MlaD [Thiomicrospira sp. WB1]
MTRKQWIEIWVGMFVLMGIIALAVVAFKVSNFQGLQERSSYQVHALFDNIGGLKERAPVKLSGVVIGRVNEIKVDPDTYFAKVSMSIYDDFDQLPIDTSASILTSGLLGDQYIGLNVGADDLFLKEGDRIELVQSAIVLEDLIGQFLTKFADSGE